MTTKERLAALEREQAETKTELARLENALEAQRQKVEPVREDMAEVRARKFVLVDKNGKTRATLDVPKEGAILTLFDEHANSRAWMGVYNGVPVVGLGDTADEVIWHAP